nr:hypothetical protein [Sedimentibacter sp.]
MQRWKTKYDENIIVVENSIRGERLYVNGELQDEQMGIFAFRSRLWGHLKTGETIKVSIGSNIKMHCRIFINDKLLFSE